MLVTLETIQKHLATKGQHLEYQNETGQLYMLITKEDANFPFFIRLYDHGQLLQFTAFMPFSLKEGHEADVARLLHIINKDIDLPGFGMDETNGIIFYRLMLPINKLHLEEATLELMVNVFPSICHTFAKPILAMAHGKESLKTILNALNQLKQQLT